MNIYFAYFGSALYNIAQIVNINNLSKNKTK